MTDEERKRRNAHPKVNELKKKICSCNSDASYVFISYKSDDWETVLTEIVYKLVNEYHLNIYYDGSFDLHNNSWIDQFPENMNSYRCMGVLAFLNDAYATSYATLMELMHSQTFDASGNDYENGLPIIPVNLGDLTSVGGALGDEDTGLGVGGSNLNADAEKALFESDYQEVSEKSTTKKGFKIYKSGNKFQKKHCSKMVRELLASKGYNTNMYNNSKEFYENLVTTIKNTCGESVFSKAKNTDNTESSGIANKKTAMPASSTEPDRKKNLSVTYPDGSTYEGEMIDGTPHGQGKMKYSDGSTYEGEMKNGTPHGQGKMKYLDGTSYDGEWRNGRPNGKGTIEYSNGNVYIGEVEDGVMSGYGTLKTPEGDTYEGQLKNGMPNGFGTRRTPDGYVLSGEWKDAIFVSDVSRASEKKGNTAFENEDKEESSQDDAASANGDITYTIYGAEYTDNQANMMLNVFAKVLKRHPEAIDKILENPEKPLLRCASAINYELPDNKKLPKPTRFNSGAYFNVGRGIFIGTGLNFPEKLRNISMLLTLCDEDFSVLQSDRIELPKNVKTRGSSSGDENYSIYGEDHNGNQTQMMVDVLKFLTEKHFDKREELAGLLCIKLAPIDSLSNVTYFRTGEEFNYNNTVYSIGTSFSRNDKLKQIAKAINICGEDIDQFKIDGLNEIYSKPQSSHTSKGKRNFLDD